MTPSTHGNPALAARSRRAQALRRRVNRGDRLVEALTNVSPTDWLSCEACGLVLEARAALVDVVPLFDRERATGRAGAALLYVCPRCLDGGAERALSVVPDARYEV